MITLFNNLWCLNGFDHVDIVHKWYHYFISCMFESRAFQSSSAAELHQSVFTEVSHHGYISLSYPSLFSQVKPPRYACSPQSRYFPHLSDTVPETAASPSRASAAMSCTTSASASLAPWTSATTLSRRSSREAISARWLCTRSKSRAFWDCVVWRRALSCDWCETRDGCRCAARMDCGGRRCGLSEGERVCQHQGQ